MVAKTWTEIKEVHLYSARWTAQAENISQVDVNVLDISSQTIREGFNMFGHVLNWRFISNLQM